MSAWLDPVARALDGARARVAFFFRDDDVGWEDDKLCLLLNRFAAAQMPLDLAVIPTACSAPLARFLRYWQSAADGALGLHQHGFAHTDHEANGRKCEFGASRSPAQQLADLRDGQARLRSRFGAVLDPVFTPPWNRCTQATVIGLAELGFHALSRDASASRLDPMGLAELPVSVDWCRKVEGDKWQSLAERIANATMRPGPLGIMLHHAVMDAADLDALGELLHLLARHRLADCRPMRECLRVHN